MTRFLVLAKAPVPGRVKTRLCPPWTPEQAAGLAAAALADTLDTVGLGVLVMDGTYPDPQGWQRVAQRGEHLPDRLANAFADVAAASPHASESGVDHGPMVLIGMDTPQVTPQLLADAGQRLSTADAVLGLAEDGGWWALGLRDPAHGAVLREIATSTHETGARTLQALRALGLRVDLLPALRDVDTAADARSVAALCPPHSRFAQAVAALDQGVAA